MSEVTDNDKHDLSHAPVWEVINSLQTLNSLRLCNRKLESVASESLFEEIVLEFTETSHAKMAAVAQYPTRRKQVCELRTIPKAISGSLLNRWDTCYLHGGHEVNITRHFEHFYKYDGGVYSESTSDTSSGDSLICYPGKDAFDTTYAEYEKAYQHQRKFCPKAKGLLQTAIGCFPNLR